MNLKDVYEKIVKEEMSAEKSQNGKPWWEPKMGVYKVKINEVGNEYVVNIKNKQVRKIRLEIEIENTKYNWGIPIAKSITSLLGQLSYIDGKIGLTGKTITVIVRERENGIKDYIIPEAIELMSNEINTQK